MKLQERDTALKAYKTENGRFADMKDKFKADIASLQQQVYFVQQAVTVKSCRMLHDMLWCLTAVAGMHTCSCMHRTL